MNYWTIALVYYDSKVILKVIPERIRTKTESDFKPDFVEEDGHVTSY